MRQRLAATVQAKLLSAQPAAASFLEANPYRRPIIEEAERRTGAMG